MTVTTPPPLTPPRRGLCLEGQFLGLIRSPKGKVKGFRLATATGDQALEVDKYVGYALHREIELGTTVRVWARDRGDELEVIMVVPLSPKQALESPVPMAEITVAAEPAVKPCKIQVCRKGSCHKRGSAQVWRAIEATLAEHPDAAIILEATGCQKACKQGPAIRISPGKEQYAHVSPSAAVAIAQELVERRQR
ncbi:MAG: (2Fe-2S) ferredoxin domain-containing protein [Spirulinaceae cyanobacterium RM2_2_10]|nr:(2Fe-2S) ferredoxin domain-containing protein [Spirulinaceae cyanobacterium SM2_1_0]NJO21016.1 (2Fe-2S) ferredoxin domain-containing protein [Spirulinaceae cyanobacterium RM2_2_10]